ncbi:MAG: EAL domain-containing protein [Acidimicrobiales bacterium]|nr:EAL domain-containing protein [Acidimicrobiales bacterium]
MEQRSAPARIAALARHPHTPVWMLTACIAFSSAVLWNSVLRLLDAPASPISLPWWLIAIGFAVVESFVVSLHFRSESGSVSLLEVPLIFGLLFTSPSMLWWAMILGAVGGLYGVRRQTPVKLAFNVANLSLHVGIAAWLFSTIVGGADPMGLRGWLAIFVATSLSAIVEISMINVVIGVTEGRLLVRKALDVTVFGWMIAAVNSVQALIAAIVIVAEPWGVLLLLCSLAMLFIAYRAYVAERDHREQVEFLHNSTRALRDSNETTAAVSALLDEATSMFRATMAEMVLFTRPESDEPAAWFGRNDGVHDQRSIDADAEAQAYEIAELAREPVLAVDETAPQLLRAYLDANDLKDAMFGTLRSEQGAVGIFVVADRLGTVTSFTQHDLRLFENLVDQAALALENDQLEQTLAQLRDLETELAHQARYDALTGLANRSLFHTRLNEQLQDDPYADAHVLYVDLDDFKLVNDRLGHAAGDALLKEVAERIEEVIRPIDLAARLGGDEFAVMLLSTIESEAVATRIIQTLSAPFLLGPDEVRIGASVGISIRTAESKADSLLHEADLAMYAAKDRGKGSVVTYSASLQQNLTRKQALQTSLRRAISEERFEVHYQPVVRLADLAIVGAEALVRWRHRSGRLLSPADFINEAERSGLILAIDNQVRQAVVEAIPTFDAATENDFFVSVNLSARHLQQPEFVNRFASDIMAGRINPRNLVLEVTETAFVRDLQAASEQLQQIRTLGVRIALDDFGTGYSSLSYLRDLPLDLLKIAQPFIADMILKGDPTFVQAITTLSKTLSLTVVAEGVEDEATLSTLQDIECDLGQGFHFARPMSGEDLLDLMHGSNGSFAGSQHGNLQVSPSARRGGT